MADEPCPFCESVNVSHSVGETGDGAPWPYVECEDCGACAEPDVWNRRAAPVAALLAERDALAAQVEAMKGDAERLDWLCERVINVREPFPLGGSESIFWASPTDDDGGHTPSNLREQIDAARATDTGNGS